MTTPHVTPFSGSWYPGRRAELESLLDRLFESSLQRTGRSLLPRPLAFVVPHAGLAYSGTVAAAAYRHLRDARPGRVLILGFAHRGGRAGVWIPDIEAFETPLGVVRVDRAGARDLASRGPFALIAESRVCDHSVEIQLPLLQKAAPDAPVLPLYVGPLDETQRCVAARNLAQHLQPGDVLLASSDLTHYGEAFGYQPFPADAAVAARLARLDSGFIEAAASLDAELFLDSLRAADSTVCGSAPIALLLKTLGFLAGEDVFQQRLDYQTSGEITGDFEHSVSYGALGYFRADSFDLDADARDALRASALATLEHLRATGERKAFPASQANPQLMRRASAFVSLHQGRELFGCVGMRAADLPLAELVPDLAASAALDDPRFDHRRGIPNELDVEISVLTPMKRLRDWQSFRLHRDGAILELGERTGLLLPQVAGGSINTETRFLEALSQKAGLRPEAYRDPQARLSVFRAQVF